MKHPIKPPSSTKKPTALRRDAPVAPQWPSYTGTSQFTGTSPSGRVTVYVDPTLDPPGLQNAQGLVNDADRVVTANDSIFSSVGGPVSVIVFALDGNTDGTGGADHMGCDYISGAAIEVCASYGNSARVSGLFEAELSECSMGGNLCATSTGEGLSRWCAAAISSNALDDFATAPVWAQNKMPDFVNQTEATDRNAVSTGCTMAFLSWLMSQGHPLGQIAPAMVSLGDNGTLAQLYASLTADAQENAWPSFQAAVQALPGGGYQRRSIRERGSTDTDRTHYTLDSGHRWQGFRLDLGKRRSREGSEPDCCGCARFAGGGTGRESGSGEPMLPTITAVIPPG
jgi:hypothetical protein